MARTLPWKNFSVDPDASLMQAIAIRVAAVNNVNYADMIGQSRIPVLTVPRFTAMYLIRELLGISYPRIGKFFDFRDHTSVIHACKVIATEIADKPEVLKRIAEVKAKMNPDDGDHRGSGWGMSRDFSLLCSPVVAQRHSRGSEGRGEPSETILVARCNES